MSAVLDRLAQSTSATQSSFRWYRRVHAECRANTTERERHPLRHTGTGLPQANAGDREHSHAQTKKGIRTSQPMSGRSFEISSRPNRQTTRVFIWRFCAKALGNTPGSGISGEHISPTTVTARFTLVSMVPKARLPLTNGFRNRFLSEGGTGRLPVSQAATILLSPVARVVGTAFWRKLPDARKLVAIKQWREAIDRSRPVRLARMQRQGAVNQNNPENGQARSLRRSRYFLAHFARELRSLWLSTSRQQSLNYCYYVANRR